MASKLLFLLTITSFFVVSLQHRILTPKNNPNSISHFAFSQSLIGCKKGDTVKGINMLKKYLQRFGYLSVISSSNHELIHDVRNVSHDDYFDEVTEAATKAYQLKRGLKPTGIIDNTTLTAMQVSRCGVPDAVAAEMSSNNKTYCHGTICIKFGSHYKFWKSRWPDRKIALTYSFKGTFAQPLQDVIARAFVKWSSVSHFNFIQTKDASDLLLSFERKDHGDGEPFDGADGILAHAFAPMDGRAHFDGDEKWADGVQEGTYDLNTVALHEIGHLLGLGHSEVEDAVMWPDIPDATTKELTQDDVDGIKALYQ